MKVEEIFANLPELETDRLLLRKVTFDDLLDFYEYSSDPQVAEYTSWEPHTSIEQSRKIIAGYVENYAKGEVAPWGLVYKAEKKFLGTVGYLYWNPLHFVAQVGWAINRNYWNMGYTTEAMRVVVDFGFERMGLNRISAVCEYENLASERVMEKVGMRSEGVSRQVSFEKGRFITLKRYAILRSEWKPALH
jgi:ribosomal-protein-alanine N-acetyltransferase